MTLADEKYVSFTTYKQDGTPKSLPVWIADVGEGRLGFTTEDGSWKVKRLHNDGRVQLQPSDARGNVTDGTSPVDGTGVVVHGAEMEAVMAAIKAKYGWQVTLVQALGKVRGLVSRKAEADRCAIVITLD
ncbi:MAG: PPOX class F420-dependent oxidoreductase [Actinomycetota bacterium]